MLAHHGQVNRKHSHFLRRTDAHILINMRTATAFILGLTNPKSTDEDIRRQEFILNILLINSIALLFVAMLISGFYLLFGDATINKNNTLSTVVVAAIFLGFCLLLLLSRKGFVRFVSYLLIGILYILAAYMGLRWGVDVSASLLFYALVIVMAGILVNTRFAFLATLFTGGTIAFSIHLQSIGSIQTSRNWTTEMWNTSDVIVTTLIFLVIATVSWLSNREIKKSLSRARTSEAELKRERDRLEIRVIERTEELRKAEVEKMTQAYRFVEFGRLASGIFHDLINPLTALSLNLETIATKGKDDTMTHPLTEEVNRAKQATLHMQNLMESMRKHLSREGEREHFSLNGALIDIIRILDSYARAHRVTLHLQTDDEIGFHGDAVHFTQVMTNLISNAIEAYPAVSKGVDMSKRSVEVMLGRSGSHIEITVRDRGAGISPEDQIKIFEPFFSTKNRSQGLGIGLSLAKRIVEKEFKGVLEVTSVVGRGSSFMLKFPV